MIENSSVFFVTELILLEPHLISVLPLLSFARFVSVCILPLENYPKETVYQIISLQTPGISVSANISYVVTMFTFCLGYKNDLCLSAVISSWIQYNLHRQIKKKLIREEKRN
jgi:hypothetical protein